MKKIIPMLALILLGAQPVFACIARTAPKQALEKHSLAFAGEVLESRCEPNEPALLRVTFKIHSLWKGDISGPEVTLIQSLLPAICKTNYYKKGDWYLMFADGSEASGFTQPADTNLGCDAYVTAMPALDKPVLESNPQFRNYERSIKEMGEPIRRFAD